MNGRIYSLLILPQYLSTPKLCISNRHPSTNKNINDDYAFHFHLFRSPRRSLGGPSKKRRSNQSMRERRGTRYHCMQRSRVHKMRSCRTFLLRLRCENSVRSIDRDFSHLWAGNLDIEGLEDTSRDIVKREIFYGPVYVVNVCLTDSFCWNIRFAT